MIRKIIEIDEEKCDGCGLCIPACPEGALKLIDGKAKLVKDFYCDGLGACLGHCPQGAIQVIERDAEAYDESLVMENVMAQGEEVIHQHLEHLRESGEQEALQQALAILEKKKNSISEKKMPPTFSACPGSQAQSFNQLKNAQPADLPADSALTHWPIQMHLISPHSPHYLDSDLLLAADCVAFSLGNFHQSYLAGKKLVIACPKLDRGQEIYLEKLKTLIDEARIKSLRIMVMQVPCCSGLVQLAKSAVEQTHRKIPIDITIVGVQGQILDEFQITQ
jgi:NAD-dependent dihydropyrimidine dehydrogenase PreA subunit